jgi:hypothetical protein
MSSAHGQIAGRRSGVRNAVVRKRRLAVASALAVLFLAVAAALPVPSLGGNSIAVAAVQRAKSLVELMHQRSPGKRTVAHLAVIKHKKVAVHERALPKLRKAPPQLAAMPPFATELPPALVDLVAPPLPVQIASLEAVPVGPFATTVGPPGFFLPPPGGFVVPPGQAPTPTPPVVTPPVVTPPVITPQAVPEPGAWALMLLGFGLIGWSLRRKPYREQTAA